MFCAICSSFHPTFKALSMPSILLQAQQALLAKCGLRSRNTATFEAHLDNRLSPVEHGGQKWHPEHDAQQQRCAGEPAVGCTLLPWVAVSCPSIRAACRVRQAVREGSRQKATPWGPGSGCCVQHLDRSDRPGSICASAATALLGPHRNPIVEQVPDEASGLAETLPCPANSKNRLA